MKSVAKGILLAIGTLSLAIGIIGIVIPLLPTTPFLLLAAACYAKSYDRFYNWLMNNRIFGNYIRNYRAGKGIPIKTKIYTLALLWITILFSAFFIITILWIQAVLIIIAIGVTIHILTIKTLGK